MTEYDYKMFERVEELIKELEKTKVKLDLAEDKLKQSISLKELKSKVNIYEENNSIYFKSDCESEMVELLKDVE